MEQIVVANRPDLEIRVAGPDEHTMRRPCNGSVHLTRHGTVVVVIPTYNRRELLVQSVRSVLEQTYGDVRCIVVDNGSTDGTGEAVTALGDPRVTLVTLSAPCGAAAARNAGLEAAGNAPWVAFLDNDDIWAPAKLEHQLAALAAHPEASWSATACVHVGPDLHVRWAARLRQEPLLAASGTVVGSSDMISLLTDDQHVPAGSSSALASLDLVLAAGGFSLDVPGCEDWDLWLRLAQRSPMLYVDLPLVAYRVWDGQTSADVRAQVRSATVLRARHFPDSGPPSRDYRAPLGAGGGSPPRRRRAPGPRRGQVPSCRLDRA